MLKAKGEYQHGESVVFEGREYYVTAFLWKRNGWNCILASSDGGSFDSARTCRCGCGRDPVPSVDLVTEHEYAVCDSCRGVRAEAVAAPAEEEGFRLDDEWVGRGDWGALDGSECPWCGSAEHTLEECFSYATHLAREGVVEVLREDAELLRWEREREDFLLEEQDLDFGYEGF